ncbi:MAG: hypothetical protein U9O89_06535 [Thermoproteota archaeon]|nr:hypothetical protein [Thermoproteota archaeon]
MKETVGYIVSAVLFLFAVVLAKLLAFTPARLAASILLFLAGLGILYYVRRKPRTRPPPTQITEAIIQELPVQELKKWFKQETRSVVEPLNTEGKRLLAEIKGKLDNVQKTCSEAVEAGEKEIERGEKPHKGRGMRKVARYFLEVVQDVNVPEQVSFKTLNELSIDLTETLNAVRRARAIWFPLISPMFILGRKKLDGSFGEIANSLKNLKSFLSTEYSKAKKIEDTFLMIDELSESLDKLEKASEKKRATESAVKKLAKKIENHQRKITEIQTKSKIADLTAVNKKATKLERKVKHSLRRLRKPLMKLKHSHSSTEESFPPLSTPKLSEYLSNPFLALATEEKGYPILKEILRILNTAMKQRKLNLKASRIRKAQEEITKIVNENALLSLQKRCKVVYLQQKKLQSSSRVKRLQKERARLQKSLKNLKRRKEMKGSRLTSQKRECTENLKEIETQKKEIEKIVRETTEKNLKILL